MPKDKNKPPKPQSGSKNEKLSDLPERKEQQKDDKVKGGIKITMTDVIVS